jgi:hypothetical protein
VQSISNYKMMSFEFVVNYRMHRARPPSTPIDESETFYASDSEGDGDSVVSTAAGSGDNLVDATNSDADDDLPCPPLLETDAAAFASQFIEQHIWNIFTRNTWLVHASELKCNSPRLTPCVAGTFFAYLR